MFHLTATALFLVIVLSIKGTLTTSTDSEDNRNKPQNKPVYSPQFKPLVAPNSKPIRKPNRVRPTNLPLTFKPSRTYYPTDDCTIEFIKNKLSLSDEKYHCKVLTNSYYKLPVCAYRKSSHSNDVLYLKGKSSGLTTYDDHGVGSDKFIQFDMRLICSKRTLPANAQILVSSSNTESSFQIYGSKKDRYIGSTPVVAGTGSDWNIYVTISDYCQYDFISVASIAKDFLIKGFRLDCFAPSGQPTSQPSDQPTGQPSSQPTSQPTGQPSSQPTGKPTGQPSSQPTGQPSSQPTVKPTGQPTGQPSSQPTGQPTGRPTDRPTSQPTSQPTIHPTSQPSSLPTSQPTSQPSSQPTGQPTTRPSSQPTGLPTSQPTSQPTGQPSSQPTGRPTNQPTGQPSSQPTGQPTGQPSSQPTVRPTNQPY